MSFLCDLSVLAKKLASRLATHLRQLAGLFGRGLMEETIEKAQIFFKLVVAPELLHGKLKNKIKLTGSSSDGLVPPATESDTTVTKEPVVFSVVDYTYLVCQKECLDAPVN